ncbi:MAG: hypothetical protein EB059_11390 [Alphaproteobacteria bacterium]|nr:hypothetical protein [Alphaproteobacteria bacterium]
MDLIYQIINVVVIIKNFQINYIINLLKNLHLHYLLVLKLWVKEVKYMKLVNLEEVKNNGNVVLWVLKRVVLKRKLTKTWDSSEC